MIKIKKLKIIALAIVVAYTFTFGLPTQELGACKQKYDYEKLYEKAYSMSNNTGGKIECSTELGKSQDDFTNLAQQLDVAVNGNDIKLAKEVLSELTNKTKTLKTTAQDEFVEIKNKISEFATSEEIANRYDNYEKDFYDKLEKLDVSLEALNIALDNGSSDIVEKSDNIINLINAEQGALLLASMPYQVVDDGYSSENYENQLSIYPDTDSLVIPSIDDMSVTNDTILNDELKALADSFDSTIEIYQYVKNNIDYEAYYGSRKGAIGTYEQKSGNDYDQSSLLIALLRYKNIPAHYVRGNVVVDIEDAISLTATENSESAVKTLAALGVPTVSLISGGNIVAVKMERVWVEAYVKYENYRGVGEQTGQSVWVPLDGSFKKYQYLEGIDVSEVIGITDDSVKNINSLSVGNLDEFSISRVDVEQISSLFDSSEDKLTTYLNDNGYKDKDAIDVFGGKKIIPENIDMLPLSLPYEINDVIEEFCDIPENLTDSITFSIKGNSTYYKVFTGEYAFNYKVSAPDIYGKRISLSWKPATSEDQKIIYKYGGVFKNPAYLVKMIPQLCVDGESVASGVPVGLGNLQEFNIAIKSTGKTVEYVTNEVTVGGIYNVAMDYGKISAQELINTQNKIKLLEETANMSNIYTEEVMGEFLNAMGKAYFAQLDLSDMVLEGQLNITESRLLSVGITGYSPRVKYMFNSPVEVTEGGAYVDIDRNIKSAVSVSGNIDNERLYFFQSGVFSSSMEHTVLEQFTGVESISTIKAIEIAGKQGIKMHAINSETIDDILPQLSLDSSTIQDITNSVNTGKTVIVPENNIKVNDWNGVGYIVLDTDNFSAAYMISGGTCGGAMTWDQALEEYLLYVVAGLAFMIVFELAQIALYALLPGGWAFGIIMFAKIIMVTYLLYDAIMLLYMYSATGDIYYLEEFLIQVAAICTLGFLSKGPLKGLFDKLNLVKAKVKVAKWSVQYKPTPEQYVKYQKTYDNPNYFNQTTGEPNWVNFAKSAVKNLNGKSVVLGKYSANPNEISYNKVAEQLKAKFFEMDMDNWNEVSEIIGKENMWNINLQFLIDNCKTGTDIYLSHDPWKATSSYENEVLWLIENGAKDFKQISNDLWKVIW